MDMYSGKYHFGYEVFAISFYAESQTLAEEMMEDPQGSLRLDIEAKMRTYGRDPNMAWHDYQFLSVCIS